MKNSICFFAFLLLVFQNKVSAAPFLVIRPNVERIVSADNQIEKPHFFKKKKLVKLAARLAGPSEWEDGATHTKGMLMAFTGLILFALGFGISVLLEVETASLFLVFCHFGDHLGDHGAQTGKKRTGNRPRIITRILAWTTITLGTMVGLLALIFNGE